MEGQVHDEQSERQLAEPIFRLDGKYVVVTGASRGIGRALAIGLARSGANVALIGRDSQALQETAEVISSIGRLADVHVCDLRETEALRATASDILGHHEVDILVNNAGLNIRTPALQVTTEEWQTVIDTDLKSAFFVAQQFGKQMVERGTGSIINVSSVGGHVALRTGVVYAAAKAGVIQMTKVLALEWGTYNVRVNGIAPWYFRTPLTEKLLNDTSYHQEVISRTPLRRVGEVSELVGPAVFLASDAASYVTGHTLFVDGGMSIYGF